MAASCFLTLRSSVTKPSNRPFFFNPIKNFGQSTRGNHRVEERAPSTAEEFQRVAEEKARESKEGIASQTTERTYDAAEEAARVDSNVGSVKNRYKEHEPDTDYRRTGN
ncbi:uncharacterized protein LOC114733928 [Neltuma alba]|uniref:uncharacterized protein LOC114726751 n=1 Tax=Neltuma alba TaxID=207710 RepID=UPI0010A53CEC|nr:uncharacterized protein LOC114726751 [Prosopis alba]XP_028777247.1 uncharacterized protein LOC114733928 [Prosopis alba]